MTAVGNTWIGVIGVVISIPLVLYLMKAKFERVWGLPFNYYLVGLSISVLAIAGALLIGAIFESIWIMIGTGIAFGIVIVLALAWWIRHPRQPETPLSNQ